MNGDPVLLQHQLPALLVRKQGDVLRQSKIARYDGRGVMIARDEK
jgi:hypothetical protein